MAMSSSPSSKSGAARWTSGDGLSSRLRLSTSSELESSVSETDGVTLRGLAADDTALESGRGCRGQVVRKKYVRRGWMGSNSFARGQRAIAVQQDRFMYDVRREEMIAQGFAELEGPIRMFPFALATKFPCRVSTYC